MVRKKNFIKRDESKQPLRNFSWNKTNATITPNFSFDAVLQLIENDPIARGAVNHFVDKCMEGDYSIVRRDNGEYDRGSEMRLEENFMFRTKILRKIFLAGKLFNNVFIEIIRDSENKTKALNVLDSTSIEAITETNGDPIQYKSTIPNPKTGEYQYWDKEDIIWIKFGDRTAGYAPVDMRALWENLLMKSYVTRYVSWLYKTGQYRVIYNFESASNTDIEDFMAYARKNDDNFQIPFVMKGKLNKMLLRDMKETSSLIEMLAYLDSQTLILLRVPPIDAGIPDASGRSNADAQANNMETTVIGAKKIVEDYINFELFPKINRSTILLVFGPMNRFAEQQLIKNAQTLNSMNIKDEVIQEYFRDHGMFYSEGKYFKEPTAGPDVFTTAAKNPRLKDNMPSREGKAPGEANTVQDEPTTREDQLKKV